MYCQRPETGVGGYSLEFVVATLTNKVGVDPGVGVAVDSGLRRVGVGVGVTLETHRLRSPGSGDVWVEDFIGNAFAANRPVAGRKKLRFIF